jgi:hypothetical protein
VLFGILQLAGREEEAKAVLAQYEKNTVVMRRVAEAIKEEAEHPSSDPKKAYEIGILFLGQDTRVGLYWLNKALERDPAHEPTRKALAEYYESKGEPEKAAQHRRRLKSNPASTSP